MLFALRILHPKFVSLEHRNELVHKIVTNYSIKPLSRRCDRHDFLVEVDSKSFLVDS